MVRIMKLYGLVSIMWQYCMLALILKSAAAVLFSNAYLILSCFCPICSKPALEEKKQNKKIPSSVERQKSWGFMHR